MRSSKSRSRSKQNRNRSVGNIINRVFDSSGPEGKVRGTPQQIIDKYNQLARDAQLGNDRVAAENFQQHAEHYTRLLSEAMREMEAQRQNQGGYQGGENGQGGNQPNNNHGNGGNGGNGGNRDNRPRDDRDDRETRARDDRDQRRDDRDQRRDDRFENRPPREDRRDRDDEPAELPAFLTQPSASPRIEESADPFGFSAPEEETDSGLVETPETAPKKPRARKPREPRRDKPPEAAE